MEDATVRVPFDLLVNFMKDVLIRYGVPADDAAVCADVLIASDKRGIDSHGVGRFKPIYLDRIKTGQIRPTTRFEVVRETPATAVVDGHNGMGQVIAKESMRLAVDKAANTGMGMVAVRNSNHYGIAGYYALMAVEADMVGLVGTNARPSIAPTFGTEGMLGTNPITFGMPTDEDFPFVLDCATSVTQRGKIEEYARLGKMTPEGWVIGEDGRYRTDTEQILRDLVTGTAALVPLGGMGEETAGYKGYGYAAAVEILSAALQGGAFMKQLTGFDGNGNPVPYRLGHFFIAISIEAFTDPAAFRQTAGDILRGLRASRKMPGAERIYTAGEKEHLAWLERKERGGVVIDSVLRGQLVTLRDECGLNRYRFPFES
ncbi:MAG TPA: Ldh family oxidoreductase [bacterium]|nr:Ldh family oxidoreductase [bacterium]